MNTTQRTPYTADNHYLIRRSREIAAAIKSLPPGIGHDDCDRQIAETHRAYNRELADLTRQAEATAHKLLIATQWGCRSDRFREIAQTTAAALIAEYALGMDGLPYDIEPSKFI